MNYLSIDYLSNFKSFELFLLTCERKSEYRLKYNKVYDNIKLYHSLRDDFLKIFARMKKNLSI